MSSSAPSRLRRSLRQEASASPRKVHRVGSPGEISRARTIARPFAALRSFGIGAGALRRRVSEPRTVQSNPTGETAGWKGILNVLAMTYGDRLGLN